MTDPHTTARALVATAARAVSVCGLRSAAAAALIRTANVAAAAAYAAGHRVRDIHHLHRTGENPCPATSSATATAST